MNQNIRAKVFEPHNLFEPQYWAETSVIGGGGPQWDNLIQTWEAIKYKLPTKFQFVGMMKENCKG